MSDTKRRYMVEFYGPSDRSVIEEVGGTVRYDYASMPELLSVEMTEFQASEAWGCPSVRSVQLCGRGRSAAQTEDFGYLHTCVQDFYRGRYTGTGVKVAIVDSGIAFHEDLNPVVAWRDFVNGQSSQYDDLYHGTHVAGIIAAKNNTVGYIGVAPDVNIYACKVLDSTNYGWVDDFIAGIDWAITQNVHIINFSIVSEFYDQTLVDATRRAYNAGIVVVSCVGNGTWSQLSGWDWNGRNYVYCPAVDYSCVGVGAVAFDDNLKPYSNWGNGLNCVAPGFAFSALSEGGYGGREGTSFSAAFVTGHLACLKQKYPSYSGQQLVNKLLSLCRSLGSSSYFGAGIVEAEPSSLSLPIPGMPLGNRIERGLNLSWTSSPGATSYTLAYRWWVDGPTWSYLTVASPSCTIQGLNFGYGYQYGFRVRANVASGSSGYSDLSLGTIAPKTPTISNGGLTANSITINVSGMQGNWDYVTVNRHTQGGDYIDSKNVPYGSTSATWTGLSPGVTYRFNARSRLWANGVEIFSVDFSNILLIAIADPRPQNYYWDTAKVSGQSFNLTATEWNAFTNRINQFRTYKGLSSYSFTAAYSGNYFTANMFNQARTAISAMISSGLPSAQSSGNVVYASHLNAIASCLNAIT